MAVAEQAVLEEVEAEMTALGTIFLHPEIMSVAAGELSPDWFSDPFARYIFTECCKLAGEGHIPTRPVVLATLPEQCGPMTRSQFFARACASGVAPTNLPGLARTLRDRWARRSLVDTANRISDAAVRLEEDPFEVAGEAVVSLDTVNASRVARRVSSMGEAASRVVENAKRPEGQRGAPTGLKALDNRLNGYRAGQLYVIAGRPGMGKSAFMVSSLRRTAEMGHGVAIFSLEMTAEEIACRAMSDIMGDVKAPMYGDILKGTVLPGDEQMVADAAAALSDLPLYIDDSPRLTMAEVAARARRFKQELEGKGMFLSVLCIDHMGLVTPSDRYRGNKVAEAGEVSGVARALAKELDCCVILLCQLSRDVEKRDDRRPVMSDLRWSGDIEQDAHVVAFLYREHYYLQADQSADARAIHESRFKLDFLIRKNRNGETTDVPLWCSIGHSMVRDE